VVLVLVAVWEVALEVVVVVFHTNVEVVAGAVVIVSLTITHVVVRVQQIDILAVVVITMIVDIVRLDTCIYKVIWVVGCLDM
jgi:hypothetical protein